MAKLIDCPVCKGTGLKEVKMASIGAPAKKGKASDTIKIPCDNARCDQGKIIV